MFGSCFGYFGCFLSGLSSNVWIMPHLFPRFNSSMQKFFMGKSANVANGNAAASSEMEDGNANYDYVWDDDPSSPLLSAGKVNQTGRVLELPPPQNESNITRRNGEPTSCLYD